MTMTNGSFRGLSQEHLSRSIEAFSDFYRAFDSKPLLDMHLRSLDTLSKVTCTLSAAAAKIGERNLAVLKTFAGLPEQGTSGTERRQSVIGTAAEQMREVHDIVRDSWSSVARELEACTRDNLNTFGSSLRIAGENAKSGLQKTTDATRSAAAYGADTAQRMGDASAETMRHAGETGAIAIRRVGDAATETSNKIADAARKNADIATRQAKASPAE